jgi:protein-glucosylgalactosylhydroxylysine glucosidase
MNQNGRTRREFLWLSAALSAGVPASGAAGAIDRRALVPRHNPVLTDVDVLSPLSVGNGEFAFNADVTGLQSLGPLYESTVPLCTQSQWGWHSTPLPAELREKQLRLEEFDTYGRPVGYATSSKGQETLFNWLRENPHRLNLARIALQLDGRQIDRADISAIHQALDLWSGVLDSEFQLKGQPVRVRTSCHPVRDCVAITVESPLAAAGSLSVGIEFPYGSSAMNASDWSSPQKHRTRIMSGPHNVTAARQLDEDTYFARLSWSGQARAEAAGAHRIVLRGTALDLTCEFAPRNFQSGALTSAEVRTASAKHWEDFWSTGGAIDLSGSTDARAPELERRIVLSQYLTAIQCAGSAPPQETGLVCNSWYGKFHLEMHWWHAAHFPIWGRTPLLEKSMGWYGSILPVAQEKARRQRYQGVRWPKMTSLSGRDSPSNVGELLIWQQPHPIALAELCYRSHPNRATLDRYRDMVMASADFMADFAVLREGRYVLGPPVIPAQENHEARKTWNPTFELAYWHEALGIAQQWRTRFGLPRVSKWDDVRERLSALPVKDGLYLAQENCPETFTAKNRDHPSMLAAYGVLNGEGVDREVMRRTLHKVLECWQWPDTWGWDYPMIAMTAARLGEPETAVDALFIDSPKNTWMGNGHNRQRANLPVYLPGNGGLLTAVAMMAAAWDGFPRKTWQVRHEGLKPLLQRA